MSPILEFPRSACPPYTWTPPISAIPTRKPLLTDSQDNRTAPAAPPPSFAALRHPGYRAFFLCQAMTMMADSIEHVISYWIMFQKFHSPALGGFAILAHWLPFLLFSVWSGALADRFDPRRLIQIGMLLFMLASLGWSVLLLTDTLEMWHAAALLVVHGFAGVFWNPSAQVLIHDIVGPAQLHSAVRLSTTARYLGLLAGPAVGGAMDLVSGVKRILVITEHTTKEGEPKIVAGCTYPLTGKAVVETIFTNLAVIDVTGAGLVARELPPGVSFEEVQAATGAPLRRPEQEEGR